MSENKWNVEAIDALALYEGLKKVCSWVGFVTEDETQVFPFDKAFENAKFLLFKANRYAMDGNDFHVGNEEYCGQFPIYHKREFNVTGIPWGISPFIVFSQQMDVKEIVPAQEETIYTVEDAKEYLKEYCPKIEYQNLESDEIKSLAFDNGMGEGDYIPCDENFAYEELNYYFREALAQMPDYEFKFENDKRIWMLGDWEIDLDEVLKNKALSD